MSARGGPRGLVATLGALAAIAGCSGRVAGDSPPGPSSSSSSNRAGPADPRDAAVDVGLYGASFEGDAGQCATVVCSGGQVCCVISLSADGPTSHPNNRCDYDCIALCLDSCPVAANEGAQGTPAIPDAAGSCGGPLGCGPTAEAGAD